MDILAPQRYLKCRERKARDFLICQRAVVTLRSELSPVISSHQESGQGVGVVFDGFHFQVPPQREIIPLVIHSDLYRLSFKELSTYLSGL